MCACGKIYMFMWVFNCICMCMCSIYFLSLQVGEGFFSPAKAEKMVDMKLLQGCENVTLLCLIKE